MYQVSQAFTLGYSQVGIEELMQVVSLTSGVRKSLMTVTASTDIRNMH
jgi:hypothetical protein